MTNPKSYLAKASEAGGAGTPVGNTVMVVVSVNDDGSMVIAPKDNPEATIFISAEQARTITVVPLPDQAVQ